MRFLDSGHRSACESRAGAEKSDRARALHERGYMLPARWIHCPTGGDQSHAACPPTPSFHDEGVLLKLSSWRPPEAIADAQHAIGARSRQQLAESSPMAVAARRRCSRWQRARILGAEHVQDARSQAEVQALSNTANEGAEEGLKGTGRQCGASVDSAPGEAECDGHMEGGGGAAHLAYQLVDQKDLAGCPPGIGACGNEYPCHS